MSAEGEGLTAETYRAVRPSPELLSAATLPRRGSGEMST